MQLFLFDHITKDPVIDALLRFTQNPTEESYFTAARGLIAYANKRICNGNLIQEYLLRCMLEQEALPDIVHLRDFLRHDIKAIFSLFWETDWDGLFRANGFLPLTDISVPVTADAPAGYAFSYTAMIACTSNEALGGAILAHIESFGTNPPAAFGSRMAM